MKFSKKIAIVTLVVSIFAMSFGTAGAQTTNEALMNQIQALLQQIKTLQDQIANLDTQKSQLTTQLQENLKLTRSLSLGMTSEEVKLLQEILATDPDIYPEGLVTGYFGALTEKAVKKFQAKFGIEQVGNVGPKTMAQLNKLLTEGAGNSGKVPPGLLIAPGIAKKIDTTQYGALPNQTLPPGIAKKIDGTTPSTPTTPTDTVAPIISNFTISNITASTSKISWSTNELATSTFWYSSTTPITSGYYVTKTGSWNTTHIFELDNLNASTTYYAKVEVSDFSNNKSTKESTFETLAESNT
jgi:peptidoglycan hydrolase-like protein with peptidoglycan-binding domain